MINSNKCMQVFVDSSRTTQFYKEFEISARNSTYDVLWGVPDGSNLQCGGAYYPPCQNSTFNAGQTWTLAGTGGLKTGTYSSSGFKYSNDGYWTVEIAFPIHGFDAGKGHGGLLDTGGYSDFGKYTPRPGLYWSINFARVSCEFFLEWQLNPSRNMLAHNPLSFYQTCWSAATTG
jgi:hypothetical protein